MKRLVRPGDLISLDIDLTVDHDDQDPHPQAPSEFSCLDTVFFAVTNLEMPSSSRARAPMAGDTYGGATTGEFGYWVDTAVTRIIQTGLEQTRVPNCASYFGLSISSCLQCGILIKTLQNLTCPNKQALHDTMGPWESCFLSYLPLSLQMLRL